MSLYDSLEQLEKYEAMRRIERGLHRTEKFNNCIKFYEDLTIEEKKYFNSQLDYKAISTLQKSSLELFYQEGYKEEVIQERNIAKENLSIEQVNRIDQHIENEIEFTEYEHGDISYGPDNDMAYIRFIDDIYTTELERIELKSLENQAQQPLKDNQLDIINQLIQVHYKDIQGKLENNSDISQEKQIQNLLDEQIKYLSKLKNVYETDELNSLSPLEKVKEALNNAKGKFEVSISKISEGYIKVKESPSKLKELIKEKTILATQKTLNFVQESASKLSDKLEKANQNTQYSHVVDDNLKDKIPTSNNELESQGAITENQSDNNIVIGDISSSNLEEVVIDNQKNSNASVVIGDVTSSNLKGVVIGNNNKNFYTSSSQNLGR
ncbi:hypothetical protein ABZ110_002871 [Listeria monocytogenes]|nr:hypothetical protein [Listeria monocytogenes]